MSGARQWVLLGAVGAVLLAGCNGQLDSRSWRLQGYLLTLYTMPRTLHPGQPQIGVRVQDRDYRVLSDVSVRFGWALDPQGVMQSVVLQPGPGRDFRGRVDLPQAGSYQMRLQLVLPSGEILSVRDRFQVSKP